MPKQVARTETIWVFGRRFQFNIYQVVNNAGNPVALHPDQYAGAAANPTEKQKNQICLHFTGANNPAINTLVNAWNVGPTLPNAICPNWPAHHYGFHSRFQCPQNGPAHPGGNWFTNSPKNNVRCPTHNLKQLVQCPQGHGALRKGRRIGAAQYVIDLEQNSAAGQDYTDVVEITPSDRVVFHGGPVNKNSIGIEHANLGFAWQHHNIQGEATNGAGANRRPVDGNRWLRLAPPAAAIRGSREFQAYQEKQYLTMILFLRYLCMTHRIPRRFLGDTTTEKMQRWWHGLPAADQQSTRSKLMRFRGILAHQNCHATKSCGGPALHRNRLFRGVIDEWWMPVEIDGDERGYYSGPFDPQNNAPSFHRFAGGTLQAEMFRDANLDALQETKSYFELDRTDYYYAHTERAGRSGTYPVGLNKCWHGGIHLEPAASNLNVFSAASGTIVAARLGSNRQTERNRYWGSQRFVLIRHTVHLGDAADPGGGTRTDYTTDPTYFFSLYMHLAPFADLENPDDANPPWFNYWLRNKKAGMAAGRNKDPNRVFCPDVGVSVGDWLGACGLLRGRKMIHFEIVSRNELTMAPWDDAYFRVVDDSDSNAICDDAKIAAFYRDWNQDGVVNRDDFLRIAPRLRRIKSYHKSEWALTSADAFTPVVRAAGKRNMIWNHARRFVWVADAVTECPDLQNQLCDQHGFMWFYHPIRLMEFFNERVQTENEETAELDHHRTNVVIDDGYLTRFVRRQGAALVADAADGTTLRPFDVSSSHFEYNFDRDDMACNMPGNHNPGPTPPTATRFSAVLLDLAQDIRMKFGRAITVHRSHVCAGHNVAANIAGCMMGTVQSLQAHADGHAIDIRPRRRNPARVRQFWSDCELMVNAINGMMSNHDGEPSRPDLPDGFKEVVMGTMPDTVEQKLAAGTALTGAEARNFILHLELVRDDNSVVWESWLLRHSAAQSVKLHNGGLVGVYASREGANAEKTADQPWQDGTLWECWLRKNSAAIAAKLSGGGVIGVYPTREQAESEKEKRWENWLRRSSSAVGVKLHGGGVIGVYATRAQADAEKTADQPWQGAQWECWLRKTSTAINARIYGGGIIGTYRQRHQASAEKARNEGVWKAVHNAWPKER